MKKINTTVFTRAFGKAALQLKKHSPEILVVAGCVGGVVSAVMACKATTKAGDILNETKKTLDVIHTGMENSQIEGTEYTKEDGKKDLTIVYAQTGVKFAKLYGPAVVLGAASIGCILGSHHILKKRNVALAAAYAGIDKTFKEYRERVVDRFGKDLDRELRYNIKAKEIEETVTDENGEEKTVTTPVQEASINTVSDYARFFDESCAGWSKDPEFNLMFLRRQQDYANEKLRKRGYLFLNEVYAMLGMDATKAGQIVGWIYDEKHPIGDNYVDFNIYNGDSERARAFVNGKERSILLDFNVDGNILDMI